MISVVSLLGRVWDQLEDISAVAVSIHYDAPWADDASSQGAPAPARLPESGLTSPGATGAARLC